MHGAIFLILIAAGLVVMFRRRSAVENGRTGTRVVVRKYKTTGSMQRDMNRMLTKGWVADAQTAAAGFVTGTRSYTVTYRR